MTGDELMAVAPDFFAPLFEEPHAEKFGRFGPGWRPLIADMARKIAATLPDARCSCLKEKFGALRCYYFGVDREAIGAILDEAEALSLKTCDVCGEAGEMRNARMWMRVRCARHINARWWG